MFAQYVVLGLVMLQSVSLEPPGLLQRGCRSASEHGNVTSGSDEMGRRREELIKLIDRAVAVAEERLAAGVPEGALTDDQMRLLVRNLQSLREEVKEGKLDPPPERGRLITPIRPIIDLGEPEDSPVMKSLHDIEQFYAKYYGRTGP